MRKFISTFGILFFQIAISFFAMFSFYMLYALADNVEGDLISLIGLAVIHPIYGTIFSFITISISLVLGLPLRLNKSVLKWWKQRQWIHMVGITIGLMLIVLAFLFPEKAQIEIDGEFVGTTHPNPWLTIIGAGLICFLLMHFYPLSLLQNIRTKMKRQ